MKNSTKESVYIIIPVHNRKRVTLDCLSHLQRNGDLKRYSVVVVDDGSVDGTHKAINQLYPNVTVLTGSGDLWWTGAIKCGMEYAYSQGAEYFIWLNDDCLPEPNSLQFLIDFLVKNPTSIGAPACYLSDKQVAVENGCLGRTRLTASPGEIIRVDSVAGYCVGLPRIIVDSIGLPNDQLFPHYGGDDMYILKATRHKFTAHVLGSSKVSLVGMNQPTHGFYSYVKQRFIDSLAIQDIFASRRSRYNLLTQFFYYYEKYGFLGILIFIAKFWAWVTQYYLIQFQICVLK